VGLEVANFTDLKIGASWYHSCYLNSQSKIQCVGGQDPQTQELIHDYGQVTSPQELQDLSFKSLSTGWYHTCGLTHAGALHCWGEENPASPMGTTQVPVDQAFC
jgi:hypothetical protein